MAFSTFIRLCNHHLRIVPEHFIASRGNLTPIKQSFLISPSLWHLLICFLFPRTNIITYDELWYFLCIPFNSFSIKDLSRPTKLISYPTNSVMHIGITQKALKAAEAWASPHRFWSNFRISGSSQVMLSAAKQEPLTMCLLSLENPGMKPGPSVIQDYRRT